MIDVAIPELESVEPLTVAQAGEVVAEDRLTKDIAEAARKERAYRAAKRLVDAEEADDGSEEATSRSVFEERALPLPAVPWSIDGLLVADGRACFAGFRKVGKTTTVINLGAAWADPRGGTFLGSFKCSPPAPGTTVLWLNNELTEDQARDWLHKITIDADTARAFRVAHLRGSLSRYNVMTPRGATALEELIRRNMASRLILDPVAPFMAACGLSVMDSRDVGIFLVTMDRIAVAAGVSEVVYVTHVGKSDARSDGDESALGAERWESAVDAIWYKGNEKDSGVRWFRAEGRGVDVSETNLNFDATTWAETLDAPTAGKGRRAAISDRLLDDIVRVVGENPGINKGDLGATTDIKGDSNTIRSAIEAAANKGLIEMRPGGHNSKTYYPV